MKMIRNCYLFQGRYTGLPYNNHTILGELNGNHEFQDCIS